MQHHAYIYEGLQDLLESLVASAKKEFGFDGGHNPDLHVQSFEKFGIDDAHALTREASVKSVSGRALYVLAIASINSHAQQALLKLFEEPQQGIIFVLLVPHGTIMPTLRSRLMAYPEKQRLDGQNSLVEPAEATRGLFEQQASAFLKANYKTRSAQVAALLKDEENTKERVRSFVTAIEEKLYVKLQSSKGEKAYRMALEDIHKVRDYIADQSPSLKMLLEHLAATLPTF